MVSFAFHAVFAHWLLLNICFHYYRGTMVAPGAAPIVSPEVPQANYLHK